MLTFQRFDAADCKFPPPQVPLLPVLRAGDLALRRTSAARAMQGPGTRHFSRGRYALHAAYRAAGVGVNGALLAPAYHCRTMLDPAIALGAAISLYAVDGQLQPDLDAVRALLTQAHPPVKALLVPHYFGFSQPDHIMASLAGLCRAHGITLIEDCSHGWQIALEKGPRCATQAGRMVVASPYKFFPCPDGGTLWANPVELDKDALSAPNGLVNELKSLVKILTHRRSAIALGAIVVAGPPAARGQEHTETGELISIHYQRAHEHQRGLALSRWIVRHARQEEAVARRRANFLRWLGVTSTLSGARALFGNLPADCNPYMFPLLLDAPDPHFFQLKQIGMPIWRWDDMAASDCGVAATMRLHLLHLPCHQSLSDAEMEWMTSALARVVA
jgi:perosamine synthetase